MEEISKTQIVFTWLLVATVLIVFSLVLFKKSSKEIKFDDPQDKFVQVQEEKIPIYPNNGKE